MKLHSLLSRCLWSQSPFPTKGSRIDSFIRIVTLQRFVILFKFKTLLIFIDAVKCIIFNSFTCLHPLPLLMLSPLIIRPVTVLLPTYCIQSFPYNLYFLILTSNLLLYKNTLPVSHLCRTNLIYLFCPTSVEPPFTLSFIYVLLHKFFSLC